MVEPPHAPIAADTVRYVGDAVAVVLAETREQAQAAAHLVAADYEELPPLGTLEQALAPGAPLVWSEAEGNVCFDWEIGDRAATDAAFETADHVVSLDVRNQRLIPNAIEPRAALAEYDTASGDYTLYTTSQNPHLIRLLLGAFVMGIPPPT
jgi:carbon-monoxide dehydrogenase large subunit